MKVILELLGDTTRILNGVEGLEDFRPEGRERVRELLEQLRLESERILNSAPDEPAEETDEQRQRFLRKALEAITSKDNVIARGILEDAVSEYPEDFEFLNYLGLVCWEQGQLRQAESAYHRAVQVVFGQSLSVECIDGADDAALRAVEGRALALYRLGDFDEQYVGCRYLAGEIYHLQGRLDEAVEHYQSVPVEPAVLYNLGLAYFQSHRLERAVHTWIRAFVANVHIAAILLDRQAPTDGCTPGHLGSREYATEFVDACLRLWHAADGGLQFLQRCFDHDKVQTHLQSCSERGGAGLLQGGEVTMECAGWLEQLQDDSAVQQLAGDVARRLRV